MSRHYIFSRVHIIIIMAFYPACLQIVLALLAVMTACRIGYIVYSFHVIATTAPIEQQCKETCGKCKHSRSVALCNA